MSKAPKKPRPNITDIFINAALGADDFMAKLQNEVLEIQNLQNRKTIALAVIDQLKTYYQEGRVDACYAADGMLLMLDALPEEEKTIKRIQDLIDFVKDAHTNGKIGTSAAKSLFEIAFDISTPRKRTILDKKNQDLLPFFVPD